MLEHNVGGEILSIITESLYDKPIVIFREYVQNSTDSFDKIKIQPECNELKIQIWQDNNNLFFLDNGTGINESEFHQTMISIAHSTKEKTVNKGYKGIGRLAGFPYCRKLKFINILSYKEHAFQAYTIEREKYENLRKNEHKISTLCFEEVMDEIGTFESSFNEESISTILSILDPFSNIFSNQDTGFLVILEDITTILLNMLKQKKFLDELGWMLPVPFKDELFEGDIANLFQDLSTPIGKSNLIPTKDYPISFNNFLIHRPITKNMLRTFQCKLKLGEFAIGFHTFSNDRMIIDRKNSFSGIRIYIDNILLCNEEELIPLLKQFGLTALSTNELIQASRTIGAMIYITDKLNIVANARRTFIEVTNEESLTFLKSIAKFLEKVNKSRYALSDLYSARTNYEETSEKSQAKLVELSEIARAALEDLIEDTIETDLLSETENDFNKLTNLEKKRFIKSKINKYINSKIKDYLSQISDYNYDYAVENFMVWLSQNNDSI